MSFIKKTQSKYKVVASDALKKLILIKPKTKQEAIKWVKSAVEWFGGGYHPDTSGKNYADKKGKPAFTSQEAELFDMANEAAQSLIDVYEIALPETDKLFDEKIFTLDGIKINLHDFLKENSFSKKEKEQIANLKINETMFFGGGAAAEFVLKRIK